MKTIIVGEVNYALSLYFSYLLPMFKIHLEADSLVFVKDYGVCRGLKCIYRDGKTTCYVPNKCSFYSEILGLEKHVYVKQLFSELGLNDLTYLDKLTIMHSPNDKLLVLLSIFLSRNTDYYRNTVKWVKLIVENNCLDKPSKCLHRIRSYQYTELVEVIDQVKKVIDKGLDVLSEALELMKIRGIGLKTINAYLLHTYGYTEYAPIDRYYREFLGKIGVVGGKPGKTTCLKNRLLCSKCTYREKCLYSLAKTLFNQYNGIVQSITYIWGRISRVRRSAIESTLSRFFDHRILLEEIEVFREKIIDGLRYN